MKCRPKASVPQLQTRTSDRWSSNHFPRWSVVWESSHCHKLVSSRLWLLMCSILICKHCPLFVSRLHLTNPQSRSGSRTSWQSAPRTYPPAIFCCPSFPGSHFGTQLKIHLPFPDPGPSGSQPPHHQTSFQIFSLRQNHQSPQVDASFPSMHLFL
jgi:hypothetical protein